MMTVVLARKLGAAIFGTACLALPLAACNQPAQTTASAPVAAAPVAPTPPAVPQYNRSREDEERWQRYLALKAAYEAQIAQSRVEGRQEQAAADAGRQASAFDAGRHDQARVDQARHNLDQAYQLANREPDPRRREQIINQAKANLAAAQGQ